MTKPRFSYPNVKRDDSFTENHYGVQVPDPYRWMEDADGEETKEFIRMQNNLSLPFISGCDQRQQINEALTKLWDYPKHEVPHREGNKYFLSRNSGLQNQSVMYVQDTLDSVPEVFLDPNHFSDDGTVSIATKKFSQDGSILAYGLSKQGSDWFDVYFKRVHNGKNYDDILKRLKFTSISWTHDNKGVFYGCYPDHDITQASGRNTTSLGNQKLYYHRIGTPQSEDVLCVEFPNEPKWRIDAEVTDCGRYLLVLPQVDCINNLIYFCDLRTLGTVGEGEDIDYRNLSLNQVISKFDHDYSYVTNRGSQCIFVTNCGALNYHLVTFDVALYDPCYDKKGWSVLVPEHEKDVLEWVVCSGDKLILCYMQDVKNILQVRDLETGKIIKILPMEIGAVVGVSSKSSHSDLFYKFSSMITPGIVYHVDTSSTSLEPHVFVETKIDGLDSSDYIVEQVFYTSKDQKTQVPMFIASRKGTPRDASVPCMLYGYGGFNISLTPNFSISQMFFIQHFGFSAVANIRGGGEYGEKWHNAGRLLNKQNCFDDFVTAAEYLLTHNYTKRDLLCIKGASNGGLLVATCANQRPDLFGAVIAAVGVMDMLRFHKFTIGYAWCSDYGNPDHEEHFRNIYKYSPLHNIRVPEEENVQYPSMLLTTADHDDRVVPSHSLKFIAELQHVVGSLSKQLNPLLIRVETKAGHGGGKPTSKIIDEVVDGLCFLVRTLGYTFK